MPRNLLIDESEDLCWSDGIELSEENKDEIIKGLELLQWFEGIIIPSYYDIFVQKASKKFGLPLNTVSGEHTIVVEDELREILS
jgi:hypothetical protein